ncbi:MAG: type II toxin-antitoxin system RelE/ParE family toxin [Planctomycetes bacterium]|nr:type II toxin-antitoxin system RelE/ParE family toxin [Planctomycetota bacterium]
MRVKLADPAIRDLDGIAAYIGTDSANAANRVVKRILSALELLRDFPNMGRPAKAGASRELVIPRTPYIATYLVLNDTVWVTRIMHSAMRWPPVDDE